MADRRDATARGAAAPAGPPLDLFAASAAPESAASDGTASDGTASADTVPMLRDLTTFHLGGPAGRFVVAEDADTAVETLRLADDAGVPVFVLSGGSNVLVGDDGFPGLVLAMALRGVSVARDGDDALVTAGAGEPWDGFVVRCLAEGFAGLESLSGVPGLVGATPVQNVGAYGAEVAQTIDSVRAYDRQTGQVRRFTCDECGFGYRDSRFKRSRRPGQASGRHVVLDVTFRLPAGPLSAPVRYAELARTLGVQPGERAPALDVREAVLGLRRSKAMLVDEADHDTWGAGSFFTNPVLTSEDAQRLPQSAPRFAQEDGTVKTSAAWLIEQAGVGKGFGVTAGGREILAPRPGLVATTSTRHVLALTNRGEASAADVVALARGVQTLVRGRFGVALAPEPVFVGIEAGV